MVATGQPHRSIYRIRRVTSTWTPSNRYFWAHTSPQPKPVYLRFSHFPVFQSWPTHRQPCHSVWSKGSIYAMHATWPNDTHKDTHTHTHTHTHPFNGPFSGTTRVSRYQKGKTDLDFTGARDSERQWHQPGHVQVCTLLQTDNHASTPLLSFLQAGCPSCRPTNSVKALKAKCNGNVTVEVYSQHMNYSKPTWTVTSRPSYKTCSFMHVSVTTWLAAVKLGQLVFSQFWTHVVQCSWPYWRSRTGVQWHTPAPLESKHVFGIAVCNLQFSSFMCCEQALMWHEVSQLQNASAICGINVCRAIINISSLDQLQYEYLCRMW